MIEYLSSLLLRQVVDTTTTADDLGDPIFELWRGQLESFAHREQELHLLVGGRLVVPGLTVIGAVAVGRRRGRSWAAARSVGMTVTVSVRLGCGSRPFFIPATDGVLTLISVHFQGEGFLGQAEQFTDLFQNALCVIGREGNLALKVHRVSRGVEIASDLSAETDICLEHSQSSWVKRGACDAVVHTRPIVSSRLSQGRHRGNQTRSVA